MAIVRITEQQTVPHIYKGRPGNRPDQAGQLDSQ